MDSLHSLKRNIFILGWMSNIARFSWYLKVGRVSPFWSNWLKTFIRHFTLGQGESACGLLLWPSFPHWRLWDCQEVALSGVSCVEWIELQKCKYPAHSKSVRENQPANEFPIFSLGNVIPWEEAILLAACFCSVFLRDLRGQITLKVVMHFCLFCFWLWSTYSKFYKPETPNMVRLWVINSTNFYRESPRQRDIYSVDGQPCFEGKIGNRYLWAWRKCSISSANDIGGFAKQGCLEHEALQRRINLKPEVEDQFQLKLHLNVYWLEVWRQAVSSNPWIVVRESHQCEH